MRARFLSSTALCLLPSLAAAQDVRSPPGIAPNTDATVKSLTTSGSVTAGTLSGDGSAGVTALGRSLQARAQDFINPMDAPFNAKCDGTTDDTAAINAAMTAANAALKRVTIPTGRVCYGASIGQASITAPFVGPGLIKTSDGNLRAPMVAPFTSAPAVGNQNSVITAFNGDLSRSPVAVEHRITGAATLGQPATGYKNNPEISPVFLQSYNTSGNNADPTTAGGRTSFSQIYQNIAQAGQGDALGVLFNCLVSSVRTGANHWLASPACSWVNAQANAAAAGAYLNIMELGLVDNGFDVTGIGPVVNMKRTNITEALDTVWIGTRLQSQGSAPVDAMISATGPAAVGLDLSGVNLSTSSLLTTSLSAAGSGYAAGDVLTMPGGTGTPAAVQVTSVDGSGVITAWKTKNAGLYSASPSSSVTVSPTGGTGTGAQFFVSYGAGNAITLPPGSCIRGSATASLFPNAMLRGSANSFCLQAGGTQIGAGGTISSAAGSNVVQVGSSNLSGGGNNVQLGQNTYDDAQNNALLFSSGWFTDTAAFGSSQAGWRILRGSPTAASGIRLTTNQGSASTTNSYLVTASTNHAMEFIVSAKDTVNGDFASWKRMSGVLDRVGSASVTYTGDASTAKAPDFSSGAGSGATIQLSGDTTLQALNATFTPPSGNTHKWHVSVEIHSLKTQ